MRYLSNLLCLTLTFIVCFGAERDADEEAYVLMNLLKQSIDMDQTEALPGFVSRDFTYDTCKGIWNRDKYMEYLKVFSSRPDGGMQPMSTDWKVTNAHFNDNTLYFNIHNYNQHLAIYPDLEFEAKKIGKDERYILTRGKISKCGTLEKEY